MIIILNHEKRPIKKTAEIKIYFDANCESKSQFTQQQTSSLLIYLTPFSRHPIDQIQKHQLQLHSNTSQKLNNLLA